MHDPSTSAVLVALAVTLAAGLATALGSLLVIFAKGPNPRLLAFGLAFAGGAMVYVSLTEIFAKSVASFTLAYDARTASLASYQLEVLRDKNRELSRRLAARGACRSG